MKPRPPVRAFGVAAVLALVGLGFFMAPELFGWHDILRAIGIVFILLGFGILALAIVAMQRMKVEIILDDDGYRVIGPFGARTGGWADVVRVTRATGRIVLYGRDERRTVIAMPRGGVGDLNALGTDIARHLDAHRGYGSVPLGGLDPE
ncbi:MAG: hypothetical protein KIT69_00290 [Propionibacteriaceae bacterium]|nr:hypothetical protein [Propionibacteriaceae bacterium]